MGDTYDGIYGKDYPDSVAAQDAPRLLDDCHEVFARWLGDAYDLDVLDVVLCAAACERLDGDPLWLLVVSGPGAAKTETVQGRRWRRRRMPSGCLPGPRNVSGVCFRPGSGASEVLSPESQPLGARRADTSA